MKIEATQEAAERAQTNIQASKRTMDCDRGFADDLEELGKGHLKQSCSTH